MLLKIFKSKFFKILIAVGLLTIIISKVDFQKLYTEVIQLNIWYIVAGLIIGNFSQVFLGVARWKYMTQHFQNNYSYWEMLKIWWIGMFLGYFVPANVGMDVYRVVQIGKKEKKYIEHISVLFAEKIMSLLISLFLIIITFPLLKASFDHNLEIIKHLEIIHFIGTIILILLAVIFLLSNSPHIQRIKKSLREKTVQFYKSISQKIKSETLQKIDIHSILSSVKFLLQPKFALSLFIQTTIIRVLAAVGGYLFFKAMNIDINLTINIFSTGAMAIIFLLPISFGSLGVREGTYILLYALFGIETEIALLLSFIALVCLLFTISIGGVIMILDRETNKTPTV